MKSIIMDIAYLAIFSVALCTGIIALTKGNLCLILRSLGILQGIVGLIGMKFASTAIAIDVEVWMLRRR